MNEKGNQVQDFFNPNDMAKFTLAQNTNNSLENVDKMKLISPPRSMKRKRKNTIVPGSLDPNLWLTILAMIGNCGNLNEANAAWNQFCHTKFTVLYPTFATYVRAIIR